MKVIDNQHVSQRSGCSVCKNGTLVAFVVLEVIDNQCV